MIRLPVGRVEITVGKPIEWDIFNEQGKLMLRRGMEIVSEAQLDRLTSYGMFRDPSGKVEGGGVAKEEPVILDLLSPFDRIQGVIQKLNALLEKILTEAITPSDERERRFLTLVDELAELCDYDIDATIGAVHLEKAHAYNVVHPLSTAILCFMVVRATELPDSARRSLMGAALTQNLGMHALQKVLIEQRAALTPEQHKEVRNHPLLSAVLLKRIGVKDRLWIDIVLQHHERADGEGYSRNLALESICNEARILAIADRYHALVSPRSYRTGLSPTDALRKLFMDRGKEVDQNISLMLIKEIGIMPPGAFVKLKNGETAVVTRRGIDPMKPKVKGLVNAKGQPFTHPVGRDTNAPGHEIVGMCPPVDTKFSLLALWDYVH